MFQRRVNRFLSYSRIWKIQLARNRLLADLLSKTFFMEKVGTGIKRMEFLCKENDNAITIKPLSTHFFLEMKRSNELLPGDGIKDGISDGIKLNKIQKEILSAILENRDITHEALAEIVGISVRNIEKNIARLKAEGLLKRIGSRKTGYWTIESKDIQTINV